MIFIFLTNNWISEVVKEIGPATIQNIDHIYNYADNIRYQADEVFDSYLLVENATKYELHNIGDILGEPMMFHLQEIFDPVFGELMNFEGHMESIRKGLEEISRQNIRLRVRLYLRLFRVYRPLYSAQVYQMLRAKRTCLKPTLVVSMENCSMTSISRIVVRTKHVMN